MNFLGLEEDIPIKVGLLISASFLFVSIKLWNKIIKNFKKLKAIEHKPEYNPSDITEIIKKQFFKNNKNQKEFTIEKSFIRGISMNVDNFNYEYIYEKYQKNKIFFWNKKKKGSESIKSNYFKLKDFEKDVFCYVGINESIKCKMNSLNYSDYKEIKNFSNYETFLIYTTQLIYLMLSKIKLGVLDTNIFFGYHEKRWRLKMGNDLTIFGDITYNIETNKIKIETPLRFLLNKTEWISKIKKKLGDLYSSAFLCSGITIAFGYYVYWLYKKKKGKEIPMIKLKNKITTNTDDFKCLICKFNPKTVILNPCSHLVICKECSAKDADKKCPLCHEAYYEKIDILIP